VVKIRRMRRGALAGATVAGALFVGIVAAAGPAAATTEPAANNTIIGGGSNTAYDTISAIAQTFNESEGCLEVVTSGNTQPYDYSCPTGGTLPIGNPPFGYGPPTPGTPYSENPFNDVVEIEPSINSSAGITQLENTDTSGVNTTETAPLNFASSARGPSSSKDDSGLNFVEYAEDGIDVAYWDKVGSKVTAADTIKFLTPTDIYDIWAGKAHCWSDVGATGTDANDLIDPYSTVTSSAVTTVFDAYLAAQVSGANSESYVDAQTTWPPSPLPKCANGKSAVYTGPKFTTYGVKHTIVQNETASIVHNADQAYAITFLSYGRYEQQKASPTFTGTAVTKIGTTKSTAIAPTETTILNGTWPIPQGFYTVYSDGSNAANIPVSSNATLNFASEAGFLCKVNTNNGLTSGKLIVDPATGKTYRSEIDADITSTGAFPLDGLDPDVPFDEGAVTTPADEISSFTASNDAYYQYDTPPTETNTDEIGYCDVFGTDSYTGK
jgi:ABC-type phosphate transport system substrate-binding protein